LKLSQVVTDTAFARVLEIVVQGRANIEVVVCSRLGDPNLWLDVLEQGGYDVLVEPFDHEEVRRTLQVAASRSYVCSPARAINHKPKAARAAVAE